jgi:NAD(P)-dependent dehydrogenase (short-subunit alcohol dehydrogenase family)
VKRALITGVTGQDGAYLAQFLLNKGYRVYGTSRYAPLEVTAAGPFQMIRMDVTDDESVARGVGLVVEREGRLDVVVNNAGVALVGPIEDVTLDEARLHLETNFFGVLRVCKAVLPIMREQHAGHIINISSLAGIVSAAYQGVYSAGKFAVEGLTEALRTEVRHFGIKVALIEPGDVRTQDCRTKTLRTQAYAEYYNNSVQVYESDEEHGYPMEKIAALVERIIQNPNPGLRHLCGQPIQTLGAALKNWVPYGFFEWALSKVYKF